MQRGAANTLASQLALARAAAVHGVPHGRSPVVYGESLNAPGKPTLLIYGHKRCPSRSIRVNLWRNGPFEGG